MVCLFVSQCCLVSGQTTSFSSFLFIFIYIRSNFNDIFIVSNFIGRSGAIIAWLGDNVENDFNHRSRIVWLLFIKKSCGTLKMVE